MAYQQANGQVENANRTILDGMKSKARRGVTGSESCNTFCGPIEQLQEGRHERHPNHEAMKIDMEFRDEKREQDAIKMVEYEQAPKIYHDSWVKPRYFQVGDQLLCRKEASKPLEAGKFAKNWEGPYVVSTIIQPGTYKLQTLEGENLPWAWNS